MLRMKSSNSNAGCLGYVEMIISFVEPVSWKQKDEVDLARSDVRHENCPHPKNC
jgi:hypothetical protein